MAGLVAELNDRLLFLSFQYLIVFSFSLLFFSVFLFLLYFLILFFLLTILNINGTLLHLTTLCNFLLRPR